MKKTTFWKLILMLLPILAVGLATTTNSVTVLNPQTGEASYYSYFALVDGMTLQMAAPMAAMLSLLSGILAAVYLGTKKSGFLKGVSAAAFLAATFAVMPVLIRSNLIVIPHVLLPILMLAEAVLAGVMRKKPTEEQKKAPRLSPR